MGVDTKVRAAGQVLRVWEQRNITPPVEILDAPPDVKIKGIRSFVAKQLRELFEKEEVGQAAFFVFQYTKQRIRAGGVKGAQESTEYGICGKGPYCLVSARRNARSRWEEVSFKIISFEELMYHANFPESFFQTFYNILEMNADKILYEAVMERNHHECSDIFPQGERKGC